MEPDWEPAQAELRPACVPRSFYGEVLNLGADEYDMFSSSLPGACPTCHVPRPLSSTLLVLPRTRPYQCLFVLVQNLSWGLDWPGPFNSDPWPPREPSVCRLLVFFGDLLGSQ